MMCILFKCLHVSVVTLHFALFAKFLCCLFFKFLNFVICFELLVER